MNRTPLPASALHLRIGRLVLDPGVLEANVRPGELETLLQASLATRLGVHAPVTAIRRPDGWMESLAGTVAERVRGSVAGVES